MRLALAVFEQVAGLAIQGGTQLRQGVSVYPLRDRLAHQVVEGLACEPRQGGEAVPRHPCPFGHLLELPAYRHGRKYSLSVSA
jgi:hypothetical protein